MGAVKRVEYPKDWKYCTTITGSQNHITTSLWSSLQSAAMMFCIDATGSRAMAVTMRVTKYSRSVFDIEINLELCGTVSFCSGNAPELIALYACILLLL